MASENHQLVNWSVVLTNVSGALIGGAILSIFGGVAYIAFTFPKTQDQILQNQRTAQAEMLRLSSRVEKLETSDEQQERQLIILGERR